MKNIHAQLTLLIHNLKPGDLVPFPPQPCSEEEIMSNWIGDQDNPLVTIVCLTYNHVKFIEEALNGFLMQKTDFPFEIVVHDDASTDGTISILNDYRSRYPRLFKICVQKENQYQKGIGPLGFAFPLAKGKYIAFCEGDDYWVDEKKILKQANFLESNPNVSLVYTDSIPFSENHYLGRVFDGARVDLTCDELKRAPGIFTLTTCFRNVLDNPIELNYAAFGDKFIWSRLGKFGSGKYMQDILPSFYRVHAGGVHSLASVETRSFMDLKTSMAMCSYYKRTNDLTLEKYFFEKVLVIAISSNGVNMKLIPLMKKITFITTKIKLFLKKA